MKYIDEFRDRTIALSLSEKIAALVSGHETITIMEVCGTHTMSIYRYGLKKLLPKNVRLLSGPGCPVCVTPVHYIDTAIALIQKSPHLSNGKKDLILATFGDMMKVPGSHSTLEKERSAGASVTVVYSARDVLYIARKYPQKHIIFLGVGFETTAPTIAASIIEAEQTGLKNYSVLTAHKIMPPVMKVLLRDRELNLDGFICPAHVSTIIGSRSYEFIARDFYKPCVIAGFEPLDVLMGIYMLLEQVVKKEASVRIQYSRVAREEGNPAALALIERVFEPYDAEWRGMGIIPESGLKLNNRYARFDAYLNTDIDVPISRVHHGCICGDILRGTKTPYDCNLFGKTCNPEHPVGACMVSSEGTCAAYYKYGEY